MSDFLTRLAERTLGLAPIARPDLTPVFAPALSEPADDSVSGMSDAVPNPAPAPPVRQSPDSSVQDLSAEVHIETAVPDEKAQPEPAKTPVAEEPSRSPHREAEKRGILRTGTHNVAASQQRQMVQPRPYQTAKEAASIYSPGPSTPPIVTTHERSRLDTKWTAPSPPTINVTIGRIEVRAVTPGPPPHAERRLVPLQSLDEYLRSRNEGPR